MRQSLRFDPRPYDNVTTTTKHPTERNIMHIIETDFRTDAGVHVIVLTCPTDGITMVHATPTADKKVWVDTCSCGSRI